VLPGHQPTTKDQKKEHFQIFGLESHEKPGRSGETFVHSTSNRSKDMCKTGVKLEKTGRPVKGHGQ